MNKRIGLIALILCSTTWAMAQTDSSETDSKQQGAETATESKDFVHTTESMNKTLEGSEKSSQTVYNNENLREKFDEPGKPESSGYSNEDLDRSFKPLPPAETAPTEEDDDATAVEDEMSDEDRAKHVQAMSDEIERLEKRRLAVTNPLLAGTAPPTDALNWPDVHGGLVLHVQRFKCGNIIRIKRRNTSLEDFLQFGLFVTGCQSERKDKQSRYYRSRNK